MYMCAYECVVCAYDRVHVCNEMSKYCIYLYLLVSFGLEVNMRAVVFVDLIGRRELRCRCEVCNCYGKVKRVNMQANPNLRTQMNSPTCTYTYVRTTRDECAVRARRHTHKRTCAHTHTHTRTHLPTHMHTAHTRAYKNLPSVRTDAHHLHNK